MTADLGPKESPNPRIMNLFILHKSAVESAKAHGDKHVIKMLLEACQMLYTAHWTTAHPTLLECKSAIAVSKYQKTLSLPEYLETAPERKDGERGFRPVHIHHPCTQWVRASLQNYLFTCQLAMALADEYEYRWSGKGPHSCKAHAIWLYQNPPDIPQKGLDKFAIAMDEEYRISSDPIVCYRHYYKTSKKERGLMTYTKRTIPFFLV